MSPRVHSVLAFIFWLGAIGGAMKAGWHLWSDQLTPVDIVVLSCGLTCMILIFLEKALRIVARRQS